MLDYLKRMKNHEVEKSDEALRGKPKKDKVFIGILIIFSLMLIIGLVTGLGNVRGLNTNLNYRFNISISDGLILGAVTLSYIIVRIRKGRK